MASSERAGINPAPTQQAKQCLVGVDFMPARIGCGYLEIAQIRYYLVYFMDNSAALRRSRVLITNNI